MKERIYDAIGGKKMKEISEDKSLGVALKILSIKRATKKSPPQLTLAISDELATQLIEQEFANSINPVIRGLSLIWSEYHIKEL